MRLPDFESFGDAHHDQKTPSSLIRQSRVRNDVVNGFIGFSFQNLISVFRFNQKLPTDLLPLVHAYLIQCGFSSTAGMAEF